MMNKLLILLVTASALVLGSCGGGGSDLASGGEGGVGSGGTGIFSFGSITGLGSIFVNGVEYDTDTATVTLEDVADLQLGMTVAVDGTVDGDRAVGVASKVVSTAELRGIVTSIDLGAGTFEVLGTTVGVDSATIFSGMTGLPVLLIGDTVLIHGLLDAPGNLRATRVALLGAAAPPVVSGIVENLTPAAATFTLGNLTVRYAGASFLGGLAVDQLANGMPVRVRASSEPVAGVLDATQVRPWVTVAPADDLEVNLAGVVTDFAGLSAFTIAGTPVDASSAQITGGPPASVGNGVKVEVSGPIRNGTLIAAKLKITHVPGTGGPVSFNLSGTVGAFVSAADFRVRGNPVDASGPGVVYTGGTPADLGNGVKVVVVGTQVINGVLVADSVTFGP